MPVESSWRVMAGDTSGAERAKIRLTGGERLDAWAVHADAERIVLPAECACCGASPSRMVRESRFAGREALLVPYCGECHVHVSREGTRALATALSSMLLGVTLAAGLPLLSEASAAVDAVIAFAFSLLPALAAGLWPRPRTAGHAAGGRAVWFGSGRTLVCLRAEFAERVARESAGRAEPVRVREPRGLSLPVALAVASMAAAPLVRSLHFARVRVVNLTDARLGIVVDGRTRAELEPTGSESARAGIELELPAGPKVIRAVDARGRIVDEERVRIESGRDHLYAPGSVGYCFSVETTGYGKSRGDGTRTERLAEGSRFWVLPVPVDLWFTPAPSNDADERSTGGLLRAVRQARCESAAGTGRGSAGTDTSSGPAPFATETE